MPNDGKVEPLPEVAAATEEKIAEKEEVATLSDGDAGAAF